MDKQTLQTVGDWAQSRVASGEEPPWTFHKLKLLAEIAHELSEGLEASTAYTPGLSDEPIENREKSENIVDITSYRKKADSDPLTNLPA